MTRICAFIFLITSLLSLLCLDKGTTSGRDIARVRFVGTMPCSEPMPEEKDGIRLFRLCDGETKVIIEAEGIEPGRPMPRELAQEVAQTIMVAYEERLLAHKGVPHPTREEKLFKTELERVIDTGYKLFHDPGLGTNGISCDMCHPDASNNHPETYPKFQTQLKKVALLRDMVNWCIENPMEGKKLREDDPRMKALEAYIISARKGKLLEPGRH